MSANRSTGLTGRWKQLGSVEKGLFGKFWSTLDGIVLGAIEIEFISGNTFKGAFGVGTYTFLDDYNIRLDTQTERWLAELDPSGVTLTIEWKGSRKQFQKLI